MRLRTFFVASALAISAYGASQGVLLVPDWTGDRVMAFSPFDGSVINLSLIVDPAGSGGHLSSPRNAIDSGRGTILVSDQVGDGVYEYSYSGAYIRTVAGNGVGPALDNVRGIAVKDGYLYITNADSGGGAPGKAIVKVELANPNNNSVWASGGTTWDPFDINFRATDVLVSDINGDHILSFNFAGVRGANFHTSVGGINFPQQIHQDLLGNVLVAGFSSPAGIYVYNALTGTNSATYSVSGPRGVYRLLNGKILYTTGSIVAVLDPSNGTSTTVVSGVSAQYIDFTSTYDVTPSSYTVVQGTEIGGGLSALRASDDIRLDVLNDDISLICQVEFAGVTTILNPALYKLNAEASCTRPGLAQALSVYNFVTGQWQQVDGRLGPPVDTLIEVTLSANVGNYVGGAGEVRARLTWSPVNDEDPASDGWILWTDLLYWTVEP